MTLDNKTTAAAKVPSGASVGSHEAVGINSEKAVKNIIEVIKPLLLGKNASKQAEIDKIMLEKDGTSNKSKFGANAILAVSLATAEACALNEEIPLYRYLGGINSHIMPTPMINVLNGGVHADNGLKFQEFMIAPVGATTFKEAIRISKEVFFALKEILKSKGLSTSVGDEGGFAPKLDNEFQAIEILLASIEKAGFDTNAVKLCLDVASSEFYKDGFYYSENSKTPLDSQKMAEILEKLVETYPVISIEDGMSEDDFEGWKILTEKLKGKCQLVGDDLFVTNEKRLENGIKEGIADAILIKPNQIGTLTETLSVIEIAKRSGYKTVISHRSGETENTFIADLAVAVNAGQIKTGSLSRSERTAKYNRLLKIEEELGCRAKYSGLKAFYF